MANETEIGIIVRLKDFIGRGATTVKTKLKGLDDAVQKTAQKAKEAFGKLGEAMTPINQALEIMQKAQELLRLGFEQTVTKALEQRAENDKQLKQWKAINNAMEVTKGLIGDIILPLLLAVAEAFGPMNSSMDEYLKKNKQFLGMKIFETFAMIGKVLTTVVAASVILVARAWTGWKDIVNLVTLAVAKSFEMIIAGLTKVLSTVAGLAEFAGMDDFAKKVKGIAREAGLLGDVFGESADKAAAAIVKDHKALDALEKKVNDVAVAVFEGIDRAAVIAFKKLGEAIKKIPPNAEELKKLMEELLRITKEVWAKAFEGLQRYMDKLVEAEDGQARFLEGQAQLAIAIEGRIAEMANSITNAMMNFGSVAFEIFRQVGEGAGSAKITIEKAFGSLLKWLGAEIAKFMAQKLVMAFMKFVLGGLMGGPLGGAIFAIGDFLGLSEGGEVPGNGSGDIVPAMLEPKELVVPKDDVKGLRNMVKRFGELLGGTNGGPGMQAGGTVPGPGPLAVAGPPLRRAMPLPALQVPVGSLADSGETRRWMRDEFWPLYQEFVDESNL